MSFALVPTIACLLIVFFACMKKHGSGLCRLLTFVPWVRAHVLWPVSRCRFTYSACERNPFGAFFRSHTKFCRSICCKILNKSKEIRFPVLSDFPIVYFGAAFGENYRWRSFSYKQCVKLPFAFADWHGVASERPFRLFLLRSCVISFGVSRHKVLVRAHVAN